MSMNGKKGPCFLKKITRALSNKRNELRVRIMIFILVHKNMDKSSLAHSFSHSLQALVAPPSQYQYQPNKKCEDEEDRQLVSQMMYYNNSYGGVGEDIDLSDDEVVYDESEEVMEGCEWGLEVVKEIMVEENKEEVNVDEAADLFIKRFKRDIMLQKQLSSLDI